MSLLKKRIGNAVPAWAVLVIIIVGTAAGAFIFISNFVERNVSVSGTTMSLQDHSMGEAYRNTSAPWVVNYTVLVPGQSSGYIYITISAGFAITTSEVDILSVIVNPETGNQLYGGLVSGYPQNAATNAIDFVYDDVFNLGRFDFEGTDGLSTKGQIWVQVWFNATGDFTLRMQISSTL